MDALSHLGRRLDSEPELDESFSRGGLSAASSNLGDAASVTDETLSLASEPVDDQGALQYDPATLPEHACAYCGIHSPSSVVKCVTCNKWFCNSRGNSSSAHIITHLVRSRHKTVMLHPDSELGDTVLECYNCGNKNVFMLGFISAKLDTVVVILCRHPCASAPSTRDMSWDTANWMPLIEDRSFLSWVVTMPSEREQLMARHITPAEMVALEDLWRDNPEAQTSDLHQLQEAAEVELAPLLLRYDDAFEYQRCFSPLVKAEAEYDRKLKESQKQDNVTVTWDLGLSKRHLVSFFLSKIDLSDLKISVGDGIKISHDGLGTTKPWEAMGYIVKVPDGTSEEVTVELKAGTTNAPTKDTTNFSIEFLWSNTTYNRIQAALTRFAKQDTCVSGYIYHRLLGHEIDPIVFKTELPMVFSVPGVTELNISQINAVRSVLQKPLSLIQGPPGTGKTVVSTTIVYHLVQMTKEPVLVCAPSNVAVDQLAERIERTGLKVVRVAAKSREHLSSSVRHLTLHERVRSDSPNQELVKLMQLKDALGELSESDERTFIKHLRKAEQKILNNADVVCCTCSGAGDGRLVNMRFRTTLIDESTQATEPECLIPIVHGCKQVILVGDHQQLGPVITNRKAAKAGLKQSLFERLIVLGHQPIRLTVQYRMHPALSEFPSNMFYEGTLQNGVTMEDRSRPKLAFPWPVPTSPMMFWSNLGQEEISSSGTSYLNRSEAVNCEKVVTRFFKDGVKPSQIGIITPYEGQRTFIYQYMMVSGTMDKELYKEVEVESVDAFQGREKDYIILSCVRSNEHQGIGFLSDPCRLNVALTRAKYGLVLLGNPRVLSKNALWSHLLLHFREKGCLVEGSISNLQKCLLPLSKPRVPGGNKKRTNGSGYEAPRGMFAGGNEFMNNMRPFDESSVETGSVLSYNPDEDPLPLGTHVPTAFTQGLEVAGEEQWPALPRRSNGNNRQVADSMSERMNKFLEGMEDNDEEDDLESIEDELQSLNTSFASEMGLY